MSYVLRKMIDASSGIPPSILKMQGFWDQILVASNAWMKETFKGASDIKIDSRTAIDAETMRILMQGNHSFVFKQDSSQGLYAISIDGAASAQIAAARLQQDQDSMSEASPLFLKLLCEDPAIALWRRISESYGGNLTNTDQSPLCEFAVDLNDSHSVNRCLSVQMMGRVGEKSIVIWVFFELELLRQHVRECRHQTESLVTIPGQSARDALREGIKTTTLSLDVVLERFKLTIGECSRLEVGQILSLSEADTSRLALSAETIKDHIDIGHGEMGSWKQQRALKLQTAVLDDFVQEMAGF